MMKAILVIVRSVQRKYLGLILGMSRGTPEGTGWRERASRSKQPGGRRKKRDPGMRYGPLKQLLYGKMWLGMAGQGMVE